MLKLTLSAVFVMALGAGAAAAPKPTGEAKLQKMLEGYTAGKPSSCVSMTPSMDSTQIEGIGIVYKRGRTLYVSRFEGGCPSLDAFHSIVTRTPSTQLCRGDVAQIVDLTNGIGSGSCMFGNFTPYEKAK